MYAHNFYQGTPFVKQAGSADQTLNPTSLPWPERQGRSKEITKDAAEEESNRYGSVVIRRSSAYTLTKPHDIDEELLADEKSRPTRGYKAVARSWREDHDGPSSSKSVNHVSARGGERILVCRCATVHNDHLRGDTGGRWQAETAEVGTFAHIIAALYLLIHGSTEQEGKVLALLSQTYPSSKPHQSSVGDGRAKPELYTIGSRVMQRCHQLLELYREFNTQLADDSNNVDDPEWLHDAERMSEMLERGNQFGKELVDTMVQPVKQPRLPMIDAENAKDTDLMAIEMFDGAEMLLDDTWGRTVRIHLDAFETLLGKEADHL
ncbi:predicted protein [Verticillium alfalfae VaMs.102]|uniref:Predicted protein n=1 Tax=Verticillium alfalfae (strain VaMs.102 / ATCC MYA-4576 / FGSC 10136) TaxID=526221 RepID=C9SQ89_VERA1|nr:predicted protein [Verticillium alfalfae VaMs.102]EEY21014.1 predicted protein [Verticillium alfalfae VaMs.102]